MSELRYHPFLDQWVITATHRQDRTFLPPDDYCPLCPTQPGGFPTEVPMADYDIVVFENKFPSLRAEPGPPDVTGSALMPARPGFGVCEVVCYTSQHDASFSSLPLVQIQKLMRVWQERYRDLGSTPGIEYVFIFENRGTEIGVTLTHPHGQIYAYPFVPPTMRVELESERRHFKATGTALQDAWLQQELGADGGVRAVFQSKSFAAIAPYFSRYPFEVWVAPIRGVTSLIELSAPELDDLADMLQQVVRKLDLLFDRTMPYVMSVKQAPTVGSWPFTRLRVEFFPIRRAANKLKYLAGSEAGAGAFITDMSPEQSAARLREIN